jgi:hypothetical protein
MSGKSLKSVLWKFFLVLAGAFLGLFILLFVLVFLGTIPFQLVGLLLFGWFTFLGRTIPQLTFNWEIALDATVALALALFGLHRILCWWVKQRGEDVAKWRFGWTAKITVMVLLLFAASISAVGIVHQIAWLCREPNVIVMIGRGPQILELSNAQQLATAARLYSMEHDDRFPTQLDAVAPEIIQSRMLYTRGYGGDAPQPFLYFPGYGTQDDPKIIIVASPRPMGLNEGGRRAVVHIDGSAEILKEADFQELIQKQHPATPAQ